MTREVIAEHMLDEPDVEAEEQRTASGIIIAAPAERHAYAFVQCQAEPGAVINFAGPLQADVQAIADKIADAQLRVGAGERVVLWGRDPFLDEPFALLPVGISGIRVVMRGFADKIAPQSQQRLVRPELLPPSNSLGRRN